MEIKEAVQKAITFAQAALGAPRTANIRLEEIESSTVEGKPVWLITLSSGSVMGDAATSPLMAYATSAWGAEREREYKVFTVAKDTGEVLSMKIRLLAVPTN
jgi:hypothetical protein